MPAKIQHPFSPPKSSAFRDALNPTVAGTLSAAAAAVFSTKSGEILDKDSLPGGIVANQIVLSLLGFIIGYGSFRLCNWLRIKALKSLLAYQGWVTQPKSLKSKLWALLLSLCRGREPFSTFQHQRSLPKQPLPNLNDTLDRWLDVAENLLSSDELEVTKDVVEDFRRNEGPKLQAFLENNHESGEVDPIARVATLTYWMARMEQMLSEERFPPVFIQNLVPLCMHGFSFIFNSNRIPGEYIDELVRYPGHGHIVVLRNSQYYRVNLYHTDEDGQKSILSPLEIKLQFDAIIEESAKLENQPPIAVLTTQNRSVWAKQRKELLKRNNEVLRDIDTSMFVVALEDKAPKDYRDLAITSLTGSGSNTWFDKCITFTGFSNGWVGSNVEHSAFDAMVFITMQEYILSFEKYENNDVIKDRAPRNLPPPSLLKWDLTDMVDSISAAMNEHETLVNDLSLHVLHPPYGKGYMKKQRLSPDGYIQMSLQLAFYRMHKHIPKTYEPSTHRMFQLGRTETVHPASKHSIAWVKAMDDPQASVQLKKELLKKAVASQTSTRLKATIGEGCDRHLMGLLCASREMGMDLPKIFVDKAWQMPFLLSTSQTPNNFVEYGCNLDFKSCVGGFAPVAHDGYGIAYCVLGDDVINFQIACWKSSQVSDAKKFAEHLEDVFDDIRSLFSQA